MQAREKKIQKMNREIEPRREKMSEGKGERERDRQIDRQIDRKIDRQRVGLVKNLGFLKNLVGGWVLMGLNGF